MSGAFKSPDRVYTSRDAEELSELRSYVDELQQKLDEIVVALGSLGLSHSEIVGHIHGLKAENERLTADLSTARQSLVEMASQRNGAVAQVRAAFESGYKAGLSVPDGFFGRTMESEWDRYAASTRLAKKGLVKLKPGRYDDVYQEGVRWLNESD